MRKFALVSSLIWAVLTGIAHATSNAYPDSASSNIASSSTTIACAKPSKAQTGDKLIFEVWGNSNRTVTTAPTDGSGHNFTQSGTCDATASNVEECVYYRDLTGAEGSTFTLTWSGSQANTSCGITSIADAATGAPEGNFVITAASVANVVNTAGTGIIPAVPSHNWDIMYQGIGSSESNAGYIITQFGMAFADITYGPGNNFGGYGMVSVVPSNTDSITQALSQITWSDLRPAGPNWILRTLLIAPASPPSSSDQYLVPLREAADNGHGHATNVNVTICPEAQNGDIAVVALAFAAATPTVTPPAGFTRRTNQATSGESGGEWVLATYDHVVSGDAGSPVNFAWDGGTQEYYFKELCIANPTGSAPTDAYTYTAAAPSNGVLNNNTLMTVTNANSVVIDWWLQDFTSAGWMINAVPVFDEINNNDGQQELEGAIRVVQEPIATGMWDSVYNSHKSNKYVWAGLAYQMGSPPSPVGSGSVKVRNIAYKHIIGDCAGNGTATPAFHFLPWNTQVGDYTEAWLDTGPNIYISGVSPGWTAIQNSQPIQNHANNEATYYRQYQANDFPVALWPKNSSDCWLGGTASIMNTAGLDTSCVTVGTPLGGGEMDSCTIATSVNNDLVSDSYIVGATRGFTVTLNGGDTTLWNYGADTVANGFQYKVSAGSYTQSATASAGSQAYTSTLSAWKPVGGSPTGMFFEGIIQ